MTMPSRQNTDMNRQMNNYNFDREGLNRERNARQSGMVRQGRRGR